MLNHEFSLDAMLASDTLNRLCGLRPYLTESVLEAINRVSVC